MALGASQLKAEAWWAFNVVNNNYSYSSNTDNAFVFRQMYPDSYIAQNFQMSETKTMYVINHGISPYLESLVTRRIRESKDYVLLFDESLNKDIQKKQMDILVRFWDNNQVSSRYFKSVFFGHGTAVDICEIMEQNVQDTIGYGGMLQLSMDGPNVNWAVFDKMQAIMSTDYEVKLLNIGSCGLHILHNKFKNGVEKTGWGISNVLLSLHRLFKDVPARRDDYVKIVGNSTFPLQFCNHRWIENSIVVERALDIHDDLKKYVQAVIRGDVKDPGTKSMEVVREWVNDPLAKSKLAFIAHIAKSVEAFLTTYQTDAPMIPFLCEDLVALMCSLMDKVVKTAAKVTDPYKLTNVDVTNTANLKNHQAVDIGFVTEHELKKVKSTISERACMQFRMECRDCIATIIDKFQDKCPLKYSLVRNLSSLNPCKISQNSGVCNTKFKRVLEGLATANRIPRTQCDEIFAEFKMFTAWASDNIDFSEFDRKQERIDKLYCKHMSQSHKYQKVWKVVTLLMLLSHGQASVERSFSVNKDVTTTNISQESLVARRRVKDHILHVGGIQGITVTDDLVKSIQGARQRYHAALQEKRKTVSRAQVTEKRKLAEEELTQLKKRKKTLEWDMNHLLKQADELSLIAEESRKIEHIVTSNSMRKQAKEKENLMSKIQKSIDTKERELPNIK